MMMMVVVVVMMTIMMMIMNDNPTPPLNISSFQVVDLEFIQIHFPIQLAPAALELGIWGKRKRCQTVSAGVLATGVGQILGSCSNPRALYIYNNMILSMKFVFFWNEHDVGGLWHPEIWHDVPRNSPPLCIRSLKLWRLKSWCLPWFGYAELGWGGIALSTFQWSWKA